jgi:hypothetical protein
MDNDLRHFSRSISATIHHSESSPAHPGQLGPIKPDCVIFMPTIYGLHFPLRFSLTAPGAPLKCNPCLIIHGNSSSSIERKN